MTDRQLVRLHRQRIEQAEHDGNVFALVAFLFGLFFGFLLNPYLFPWF